MSKGSNNLLFDLVLRQLLQKVNRVIVQENRVSSNYPSVSVYNAATIHVSNNNVINT